MIGSIGLVGKEIKSLHCMVKRSETKTENATPPSQPAAIKAKNLSSQERRRENKLLNSQPHLDGKRALSGIANRLTGRSETRAENKCDREELPNAHSTIRQLQNLDQEAMSEIRVPRKDGKEAMSEIEEPWKMAGTVLFEIRQSFP